MRRVWRIGLFETQRLTAGVSPKGFAAFLLIAVFLGLVLWQAVGAGLAPDADVFPAEVVSGHPLAAPLASDLRFDVIEGDGSAFARGDAVLWIHGDEVTHQDSEAGRAAVQALEQAVRHWLDDRMRDESDQAAAFPVRVNLLQEPRVLAGPVVATGDAPAPAPTPGPGPAAGDPPRLLETAAEDAEVRAGLTPAQVEPPFPMRSLLLTFAYMIPMNLIGQTYSGALMGEKVRGRGVLLLSGPVTGRQVLLGKSLPYLGAVLVTALVVTLLVGATWVGLLAALSFLTFLGAASTVLGLLSRNLRELTFFQVGLSSGTSLFLFLPAIFTAIPPVAFLSPVHVVAASIRGDPVPLVPFLYATVPLTLATVALTGLAAALYREETLSAPRDPGRLFLDGLRLATPGRWAMLAAGGLVVPFAYAGEILIVVAAVTMDLRIAFLLFLFGGAAVEEAVKALPGWAWGRRSPRWTGVLLGTGFFLAEKMVLLLGLYGFSDLPFGSEALAAFGAVGGVLLVAPLALHAVTATLSTAGARHGKTWGAAGYLAAVAVHVTYNAVLVLGVGL